MLINEEDRKRIIREAMKNRLPYCETIYNVVSDIGKPDIPDYDKETFEQNLKLLKQISSSITNTYSLIKKNVTKATEDWEHPFAIIDKNGIAPTMFILLLSFLRVLRSTAKGIDDLAEAIVKKGYTVGQQPQQPQEDPNKKETEKGDDFLVTLFCNDLPFLKDLSDEDKKSMASGAVKAPRNVNDLLETLNTEEQHQKIRDLLRDVAQLLSLLTSKD